MNIILVLSWISIPEGESQHKFILNYKTLIRISGIFMFDIHARLAYLMNL